MQKRAIDVYWLSAKIFKSRVAFVAFVATAKIYAIVWSGGGFSLATLATNTLFRIIILLLLLPESGWSDNIGNKLGGGGNKVKNHCCRTFAKNSAIAANGDAKQHWQQKQHNF